MQDYWLYGVFAAALASPPAHLKGKVELLDGGGNYTTMIIPVLQGYKQFAVMSFCGVSGHKPGDERRIYPVFASIYVSYPDKRIEWRDIKLNEQGTTSFSRDANKEYYLGVIDRSHLKAGEWAEARTRYNPLISLVMERQWLLTRHAVTPEERATARELQQCVRVLYDKPLLPYYHHVGSQFFAWLERAAK